MIFYPFNLHNPILTRVNSHTDGIFPHCGGNCTGLCENFGQLGGIVGADDEAAGARGGGLDQINQGVPEIAQDCQGAVSEKALIQQLPGIS